MVNSSKITTKRFLFTVLVAYFFVFFFSYFYFMAARPLIIGNVVSQMEYNPETTDYALMKTFGIIGIIVLIVIFIYVIPLIIHKKQRKVKEVKIPRYKPFKNL